MRPSSVAVGAGRPFLCGLLLGIGALTCASAADASFVTFESGQVRPLALSPDGTRLFAVNTPDDRLEIFDLNAGGSCALHRCR